MSFYFTLLGNGKSTHEPPQKKRRFHGYKEDPFIFFEDGDEAYKEVKEYFKLKQVSDDSRYFILNEPLQFVVNISAKKL